MGCVAQLETPKELRREDIFSVSVDVMRDKGFHLVLLEGNRRTGREEDRQCFGARMCASGKPRGMFANNGSTTGRAMEEKAGKQGKTGHSEVP